MSSRIDRKTVDLSAYPDLVVIYLGMRVRSLKGLMTLLRIGRPTGFQAFAPGVAARGSMFSARSRLRVPGEAPAQPAGVTERELN